ncbi:asparagine synthase-related protein [Kitasatospora sp. NPDC048540]|uniref:asparagine synthase-related protein n=1 Tax=Kitasatospora sp. NPDC048540 TaxID=3155634 RepID=UPI003404EBC8
MTFVLTKHTGTGFLLADGVLRLAGGEAGLGLATGAQGRVTLAVRGHLDTGQGPAVAGEQAARRLMDSYLRNGETFLDGVTGGFGVLVDDARTGRSYAARDAAGEGALFAARTADRTAVGTGPAETAAAVGADRPRLAAFAQFLTLNYPLADGWYLDGVHPLAPGVLHLLTPDGPRPLRTTASYPGRDARPATVPPAGELTRALAEAGARLLDGPAALHLSGGVDTSLIAHALHRLPHPGPLRTYSAFYRQDDADRAWAASVAAETGSDHRELPIATEDFLDVVDRLTDALGAPVMAIGVPTFWHLGRAAAQDGAPVVLSGVAADHPLVGWNRLDRLAAAPVDPGDLPVACAVHVAPDILTPYLADGELRAAVAEVPAQLRELMPYGESPARSVERFHAEHFLPEHLRSAAVAHGLHGVGVRHPFLAPEVSALGFRAASVREEAVGKRYLRRELDSLGCWAASRHGKQQQALSFESFRAVARERLLDRLAGDCDLFGLDTRALARLAASDRPAPAQELRLLWLVHSYLTWRERRPVAASTAPSPMPW